MLGTCFIFYIAKDTNICSPEYMTEINARMWTALGLQAKFLFALIAES